MPILTYNENLKVLGETKKKSIPVENFSLNHSHTLRTTSVSVKILEFPRKGSCGKLRKRRIYCRKEMKINKKI